MSDNYINLKKSIKQIYFIHFTFVFFDNSYKYLIACYHSICKQLINSFYLKSLNNVALYKITTQVNLSVLLHLNIFYDNNLSVKYTHVILCFFF